MMYAGYVEDDAKVAARWAKRCKQAEEIIKQKQEAEQSAQLSNIQANA